MDSMDTAADSAEMREGDWTCTMCGNLNYSSRQVCNRCRGPKPPPPGHGRDGDWLCPVCSNHNYARRQACNKCGSPKPGPGMPPMGPHMGGAGGAGGAGGGNSNFRPGDWNCAKCGNHNYSSRDVCNRCQAPKTVGPGPAGPGGAAAGPCGAYGPFGGKGCPAPPGGARPGPYPGMMMMMMPGQPHGNMRSGDWICPKCQNHNYASRDTCNKCDRSKNLPPNFREGDWMCPSCNNHNYASKTACNKCKEPKPSNPELSVAGGSDNQDFE